jgi:hypothetical protein
MLGLFALIALASGAGTILTAFVIPQHAIAPNPGVSATPSPHVLGVVLGIFGLIELLIAGWAISTIVGLVRLKNWARYSILVIGGLLAFIGLTSAASLALLPAIFAQSNQQGALPPHLMQGLLIGLAVFYTAIAGTGVWWLVYFNLRSVKAYFLPHYVQPTFASYPTAASLATPGGLDALPAPPPIVLPMGRFAGVPTSIKVIACFFFFGAVVSALFALLPFPANFASFYVYGLPGHLLNFAYAVFIFLLGFGLLRLDNRARLGVYALVAWAVINVLPMFTAGGRERFLAYNQHIQQQMQLTPSPAPLIVDPSRPVFIVVAFVFGLIFYGIILFLIERHRDLFQGASTR